jgi:hypothetical protein
MLNGWFRIALCSLVVAGRLCAQEVIVARETKPHTSPQATPAPEQVRTEFTPASEQTASESPAATPKRRSRAKKSSSAPTIEEMRMAGAAAAERSDNHVTSQPAKTHVSEEQRPVSEAPVVTPSPRSLKKEVRAEHTPAPRRSSSGTLKSDTIAPIRPTMMESGREEPSATP